MMNREIKYFQKRDFLRFSYTFLLDFRSLQEHYLCLLNISFVLFVAKNV